MFVTLRRNEDSLSIERKDFAPSHQACDDCRNKKMRCSGQRSGCHRCLERGLSCQYPHSITRSGPKRRRISSQKKVDFSPSDAFIDTSSALQTLAYEPLTPSLDSSSQEENGQLLLFSTERDTRVTNAQSEGNIQDSGSGASAVSEFFCDFVAPYAPYTQQERLSTDDMCVHISATATDSRTSDSASRVLPETAAPKLLGAEGATSEKESASKPCQCVLSMLSLLEEFEIEGERLSLGTVDHLLRLNKHGLARCYRVLECRACPSSSQLVMLIITICRTTITQHERMYKTLMQQYEKMQRLGRRQHISKPNSLLKAGTPPASSSPVARDQVDSAEPASEVPADTPILTMGIVALNDYEVDALEEPCVFGGLATMQQRALVRFMAQLRQLCSDWPIHCDMLIAMEKRVGEQLGRARTYHDYNEG